MEKSLQVIDYCAVQPALAPAELSLWLLGEFITVFSLSRLLK